MNELTINHEPKLLDAIHGGKPAPAAPRKKEIFVLDEEISGWEEIDAIKTIAAGLRKGDTLTLRREPDDETRSFVIGVYDKLGQKIGYLEGGNMSREAETAIKERFTEMYENRDETFGNGRDVRNIFEKAVIKQATRLAGINSPTNTQIITLEASDVK